MEFQLKRDIKQTIAMMEQVKEQEEPKDPHFQPVFAHSTVAHAHLYPAMDASFDHFLGIVGSGAPMLNAICMGAKDVTSFDISIPTFYYQELLKAAIPILPYEEFMGFFYDVKGKRFFSPKTYKKVREALPTTDPLPAQTYFDTLYDYAGRSDIQRYFFQDIFHLEYRIDIEKRIPYEKEKDFYAEKRYYEHLQKQIEEVTFHSYIADMKEIPELLRKKKYHAIYVGAAHEFLYPHEDFGMQEYLSLMEQLKPLLEENGVLQAGYFYSVLLKLEKENMRLRCQQLEQAGYIEKEIEKGILSPDPDKAYVYKRR